MFDIQTISIVLTALSFIIAALYYMIQLKNQNMSRQIQILNSSKLIGDFVWRLYNQEFSNFEDFWNRFTKEEGEFRKRFLDYFNELERLGVFVSEGLLDVRYVALIAGGGIVTLWEKYEKMINEMRENYGSGWFIRGEKLYKEVKDFYKKNPHLSP
jgi:hypothetical protein